MSNQNNHINTTKKIILFDGICNLCNRSINTIIKFDKKDKFRFCSLQSELGQHLIKNHLIKEKHLTTIVLITSPTKHTTKSKAIFQICKELGGVFTLIYYLFNFLPIKLTDTVYDLIAKNRYRLFGKKNACRVPTSDIKKKFI